MNTDWTALLAAKGLEAPGYQETLADMRANPWVKHKKALARGKGNKGRGSLFPSAKHSSD
jgi:hypothetical protein